MSLIIARERLIATNFCVLIPIKKQTISLKFLDKPMKKIALYFSIMLFYVIIQACHPENKETYWKADKITTANGEPIHQGVKDAYMTMILNMQMHLSYSRDSLTITYPEERKIKTSAFTSFSQIKMKEYNNRLLDSVYDVAIEKDSLRIKFYFGGDKSENKYVLSFSPLAKEPFLKESQQLNTEKQQLLKSLTSVDYSAISLGKAKPSYFSKNANLSSLNPIQFAEMAYVDVDCFQADKAFYTFNLKDKGQLKYNEYNIKNSRKLGFMAGEIAKVKFQNLKVIENDLTNKTDAIILSQQNLSKEELIQLFRDLNSTMGTGKISEGKVLEDFINFEITWANDTQIVKLVITNNNETEDVYDKLAFDVISKATKPINTDIVLDKYLSSIKQNITNVTIVAKELSEIIKIDEFKNRAGGIPFTVDFNH